MIIVEIKVPVLKDAFDFQLDERVPIEQLLEEINGIMCKKINRQDLVQDSSFLLCCNDGIMDPATTLQQNGVKEGDTLLLV